MRTHLFLIASLLLTPFCQVSAAAAPASTEKMNGLLTNSPFGAAKSGGSASNTGGEPFEFRAVLEENGNKFFSIYETATRRSNWLELNDPVNGFSVKGYDVAKETITIDYQGRAMTLAIKRAPVVAQVMQQPPPMPVSNGAMVTPGNGPTVQTAPTVADQQRIQQIQEEIRRRRALRSQAAVPGANPGAQPNYGSGPQPTPSTSMGPVPQLGTAGGPQPIPQKP